MTDEPVKPVSPLPDVDEPLKQAPKIETPVIQSQDLEHQPRPESGVNTKGVRVTPNADADEKAIDAMEELEKQYREQVPS